MSKETPKVVDSKGISKIVQLSTEQRLERLERLTVRLLLAMPSDMVQGRLINTDSMPVATRNALRKRYYQHKAYAGDEADYAFDAILAMCKADIQEEQAILSKAEAKADAIQQKQWRTALEVVRKAAKEALEEAEAKLTGDRVEHP